ncbi:GNAT family N-acetyltransferase [Verrucosispora sioxanthis]|uniref:GNAT family N-acetyltransferase n=1 Tax=Verrucosispora sioxanthis TaxID=2499994 RepID=A0A6M1LAM7_9ACTN|nr:GNAT family N-acetyltransferase [Verrucosispora sioxanthis]NEE66242.1 GNAT family N-acetyltransferase [Verrucosispora sioxanthis]NGM15352.1 GNAT family N-acetyltransferase [Verrucosispora sioxanthis]
MSGVRRASVDDARELVRLRAVMLGALDGAPPEPGEWQHTALRTLRRQLPDPEADLAAYVVDAPGRPGTLAACAVGVVDLRLGGPADPSGRSGYVFNVATDPAYRRRGFSRVCLGALLDWFAERGVRTVELKASPEGEPLYRELGFRPTSMVAMRRDGGV